MNRGMKIIRTSKTRVTKLPSYKTEKPAKSSVQEQKVSKDEVVVTESGLGDVFEDLYGDKGEEIDQSTVTSAKPHVRRDDESDDDTKVKESPAKPKYKGRIVNEGVRPSKTAEVESADLDDLISKVMEAQEDEETSPKRNSTSTPSKDEANDDADFGDGLSLIRGDDEPINDDKPRDHKNDDTRRKDDDGDVDDTIKPLSPYKRSSGGTTTTTKTSYSSKFVPNIPASFYKDLQSRLEDLIFKFECLDNEYAALQKISHNIYVETSEIKKKFSI